MTKDRNRIIELAKKLNELKNKGVGGEKYNATEKLEELMRKHGITYSDLEEDEVSFEEIKHNLNHKNLLISCICFVMGKNAQIYGVKRRKNVLAVKCTNIQFIEILAVFNFYKAEFNYQFEVFESAFIQKNKILPPDADEYDISNMSYSEKRRILDIIKMSEAVNQKNFRKQLEM